MFLGKQYFIASPECASCNIGAEFGKLTTYYLHSISHKFRQKEDSIRHCLVTNVISCSMYIAVASHPNPIYQIRPQIYMATVTLFKLSVCNKFWQLVSLKYICMLKDISIIQCKVIAMSVYECLFLMRLKVLCIII